MKKTILRMLLAGAALAGAAWGCGTAAGVPAQRMADAESADRSARELGAANKSTAQLNLRLAEEQIEQAKRAVKDGDNERANLLLIRARADAELALARARLEDAVAAANGAKTAANAALKQTEPPSNENNQ